MSQSAVPDYSKGTLFKAYWRGKLMQISTKFTIAIHILAAAEYFGETEKITSDLLAASISSMILRRACAGRR